MRCREDEGYGKGNPAYGGIESTGEKLVVGDRVYRSCDRSTAGISTGTKVGLERKGKRMDSMFGFVSWIVLGCGIYGIYAYIKMRKDGHINETLLLGKSYMESMCKDKEAFLKKAMPAVLVFGVTAIAYGLIDVIHYFVKPIPILDYIGMAAFLIMLVWYMVYTGKLKKEYF